MPAQAGKVRLRLFGRPEVSWDGAASPLHAERHHRLLAYLAVSGAWAERDDLAAMLWPALSRDRAQANLRKALHLARALPWAGALESERAAVRFRVECDVLAFEAAAREGRIADALRLRRGELLDGFDDDANHRWSDWLADERARLAERWQALARLRLAQLDGAPNERAALARDLLARDPLDEQAVIALLLAQRALGRRVEQRDVYEQYAALLKRELGASPSAAVAECLDGVASGSPTDGADGFVGRGRELEELSALLARDECRLLTITGPGGVGKSRLAKEAVRRLAPRFGGTLWIPMDDLVDATQVVARIAGALGLSPGPLHDVLELVCAQRRLARQLLVLDNGEHVTGLPRLVQRLLADLPGLRICATSRARLHVRGEWLLPLAGLTLPDARGPADEQLDSDAARLFFAAASGLCPGFDAAAHARDIARLVRAVDGLPLAILLAANWVRLIPVREIVAELGRSLDVLDAGEEGEERPEHRSVRATFDGSWRLLGDDERHALSCLSVFVGTFALAAAREVVDAPLPLFAALADKSLLNLLENGRCALHPLIRRFAGEHLVDAAREQAIARHAAWFHRLLDDVGHAYRARGPKALDVLDADLENCRAAWRWAVAHAASAALAASVTTLLQYFEIRGRALEGLALFGEALPAVGRGALTSACAASVVSAVAHLEYRVYRNDEAIASARRALKLARLSGNRTARFRCLNALGLCAWQAGRHAEAQRYLEQALALAREFRDGHAIVIALGNLGVVEKTIGHYERARELMLEVLGRQRELGDWVGVATRLNNLATLHQARGEWREAREYLQQGLDVTREHGIGFILPHLLINLAHVEFFADDLREAARVAREALDEARNDGNGNVEATALLLLVRLAVRRGALDEARSLAFEAIGSVRAMGSIGLKLDAVFCFAEVLAAEGERAEAASLMRYFVDRPEIEPGDRALAQAELDRLGEAAAARAPVDDVDTLLQRLAGARSTVANVALRR